MPVLMCTCACVRVWEGGEKVREDVSASILCVCPSRFSKGGLGRADTHTHTQTHTQIEVHTKTGKQKGEAQSTERNGEARQEYTSAPSKQIRESGEGGGGYGGGREHLFQFPPPSNQRGRTVCVCVRAERRAVDEGGSGRKSY